MHPSESLQGRLSDPHDSSSSSEEPNYSKEPRLPQWKEKRSRHRKPFFHERRGPFERRRKVTAASSSSQIPRTRGDDSSSSSSSSSTSSGSSSDVTTSTSESDEDPKYDLHHCLSEISDHPIPTKTATTDTDTTTQMSNVAPKHNNNNNTNNKSAAAAASPHTVSPSKTSSSSSSSKSATPSSSTATPTKRKYRICAVCNPKKQEPLTKKTPTKTNTSRTPSKSSASRSRQSRSSGSLSSSSNNSDKKPKKKRHGMSPAKTTTTITTTKATTSAEKLPLSAKRSSDSQKDEQTETATLTPAKTPETPEMVPTSALTEGGRDGSTTLMSLMSNLFCSDVGPNSPPPPPSILLRPPPDTSHSAADAPPALAIDTTHDDNDINNNNKFSLLGNSKLTLPSPSESSTSSNTSTAFSLRNHKMALPQRSLWDDDSTPRAANGECSQESFHQTTANESDCVSPSQTEAAMLAEPMSSGKESSLFPCLVDAASPNESSSVAVLWPLQDVTQRLKPPELLAKVEISGDEELLDSDGGDDAGVSDRVARTLHGERKPTESDTDDTKKTASSRQTDNEDDLSDHRDILLDLKATEEQWSDIKNSSMQDLVGGSSSSSEPSLSSREDENNHDDEILLTLSNSSDENGPLTQAWLSHIKADASKKKDTPPLPRTVVRAAASPGLSSLASSCDSNQHKDTASVETEDSTDGSSSIDQEDMHYLEGINENLLLSRMAKGDTESVCSGEFEFEAIEDTSASTPIEDEVPSLKDAIQTFQRGHPFDWRTIMAEEEQRGVPLRSSRFLSEKSLLMSIPSLTDALTLSDLEDHDNDAKHTERTVDGSPEDSSQSPDDDNDDSRDDSPIVGERKHTKPPQISYESPSPQRTPGRTDSRALLLPTPLFCDDDSPEECEITAKPDDEAKKAPAKGASTENEANSQTPTEQLESDDNDTALFATLSEESTIDSAEQRDPGCNLMECFFGKEETTSPEIPYMDSVVVQHRERAVLSTLIEEPAPNQVMSLRGQVEMLMIETFEQRNVIAEMRRSHESRITPFRDCFEEMRHWKDQCVQLQERQDKEKALVQEIQTETLTAVNDAVKKTQDLRRRLLEAERENEVYRRRLKKSEEERKLLNQQVQSLRRTTMRGRRGTY